MKTRTLNIVAVVYFALTVTLAIILGSCASSGHACDAYGQVNTNKELIRGV